MFQSINEYVTRVAGAGEAEKEILNSLLQYKEIPKKTCMLSEGAICHFECYINKGCIRTYYINENGAEVTLQFAVEGWWVSDIASFHERKPSKMFIETLEDCEVLLLSPDSKELLLKSARIRKDVPPAGAAQPFPPAGAAGSDHHDNRHGKIP